MKKSVSSVEDFTFENRRKKFLDKCPCYAENKPCHDMPPNELNCLLCFCPEYDTSKKEGGCKIKSKSGKWFFSDKLPKGKIWDCSDCVYPHRKDVVKKYLDKIE